MRLIDKLDAIIREQVKPLENIEGIKILHVDGLGGGGGGGGGDFAGTGGRLLRPGRELGAALPRPGAADRRAAAGDRHRLRQVGPAHWRPAFSRPPPRLPSRRAAVRDQGLHVERDRRLGGRGLGPYPRLQRPAEVAPGDRRIADRGQLAVGPRRLHPQFPAARRRHHPRAASQPVRLRLSVHLLDPRIADGRRELYRHPQADAGHRRQPHLRRMVGRVRLAAGPGTQSWPTRSARASSRPASTLSRAISGTAERHAARDALRRHRRADRARVGGAARLQQP